MFNRFEQYDLHIYIIFIFIRLIKRTNVWDWYVNLNTLNLHKIIKRETK